MPTLIGCFECENSTRNETIIPFPTDTFRRNFNLGLETNLTAHFVPQQALVDSASFIFPSVVFSETFQMMLATEEVLKKDWDNPIEDEAWASL